MEAGSGGIAAENGEGRQVAEESPLVGVYSIPDAAALCGVPVRTFRDWVNGGKVQTVEPVPPQRGRQVPAAEVGRIRQAAAADHGGTAISGGDGRQVSAVEPEHERREAADGGEVSAVEAGLRAALEREGELLATLRGELERERTTVADLRAQVAGLTAERDGARELLETTRAEVDFLRRQVEEARTGEKELRVLMLRQSEQITALQPPPKSLPESVPVEEKKRHWWKLGK